MDLVDKYFEEINEIRGLIKPIVDEYYPSKASREAISMYDLITVGILARLHFNGVVKHAYIHFIEDLKLFPRIRYNKQKSCDYKITSVTDGRFLNLFYKYCKKARFSCAEGEKD